MQQNLIEVGPHQFVGDFSNLTPLEVADAVGGISTNRGLVACFIDGEPISFESDFVLDSGSTVLFVRRFGHKGSLQNDLERVAASLEAIAAQLEQLNDSLTDSVEFQSRLADRFAPNTETVGTAYVASRLGVSTRYIGDLSRGGGIPSDCIVPKSGSGKYWKFHKHKIDRWIEEK